jgi:23S rRNA pseudouridine2605 synthase
MTFKDDNSEKEPKLQLVLRNSGIASRRKAEELITQGSVTVNGQVITDPTSRVNPERDHIKVHGKLIRATMPEKEYFLFNKPRHVVSTMDDPEGRPCVGDYLRQMKKALFTVGRLDFDAEGLMILTNDGQLAQKLSHPSNRMPRVYLVKVKGVPDKEQMAKIKKGMSLGEGDRVGDIEVTLLNKQSTTTWIKIVLYEGKRNEIKRIFFRIDHPVRKIRRIGFGPFVLGALPSGEGRPLTSDEMTKLKKLKQEIGEARKSGEARPPTAKPRQPRKSGEARPPTAKPRQPRKVKS